MVGMVVDLVGAEQTAGRALGRAEPAMFALLPSLALGIVQHFTPTLSHSLS